MCLARSHWSEVLYVSHMEMNGHWTLTRWAYVSGELFSTYLSCRGLPVALGVVPKAATFLAGHSPSLQLRVARELFARVRSTPTPPAIRSTRVS